MRLIFFGFLFVACQKDAPLLKPTPTKEFIYTINEVIRREGYSETPYRCPNGTLTVGHGNTTDIRKTDRVCALNSLQSKLKTIKRQIDTLPLRECQKWALVSLIHNVGLSRVKHSKLWKSVRGGQMDFDNWLNFCFYKSKSGKWVKSANLLKSRQFEIDLFNSKN